MADSGPALKKITDPMKELLIGGKHPLNAYMSDNKTHFIMVRAPNEAFLNQGIKSNQWAIS